jgi:hypothetical protein
MAKTVNERRTETVSRPLSGGAKHCLVEPDIVWLGAFGTQNWRSDLVWVMLDIVQWGQTLFGRRSLKNVIFYQNPPLSSQVCFLSYSAPNQMKLRHKGHLNTRNRFPKDTFSKSNDFPFDFWWTQKPRVWSTQIHGRNRRKTPPNSWMKNRVKILRKSQKKKNNPYDLEMRFTHRDQLYW